MKGWHGGFTKYEADQEPADNKAHQHLKTEINQLEWTVYVWFDSRAHWQAHHFSSMECDFVKSVGLEVDRYSREGGQEPE